MGTYHKGKTKDTSLDKDIAMLYRQGWKVGSIAYLLHKSSGFVSEHLESMGFVLPRKKKSKIPNVKIGTEIPKDVARKFKKRPEGIALIRQLIEYNRKSLLLIEHELNNLESRQ